MTKISYVKCAAAAVILLSPSAAFARDAVHSSSDGVRSFQSLPPMTTGQGVIAQRREYEKIAEQAEAASPPYCSGNKYGLGNGEGAEHGRGKPFSCGKSPG